jgi:tRNA-modifying protein YgfZ
MSAFLVDRTSRLRMVFSGEKAKESLGGLVTNDVVALSAGHGQRAVALTAKGRVIAMVRVFDRGGELLVDCEAQSAEGFAAMIRKFVNPRTAKYTLITESSACLAIHGPQAAKLLAPLLHVDHAVLDALPTLGLWRNEDGSLEIIRSDELSVPGFELVASRERVAELRAALEAQGIREADAGHVEMLRIERGLPRFGLEMDAETIPQEANLDVLGAISFTKGCYTGQEVVARIHFRGHVNRHLRWLRSEQTLAPGAVILDDEGKEVGDIRSSTLSADRGPLAIGMLRREIVPGSDVRVRSDAGEFTAHVVAIA